MAFKKITFNEDHLKLIPYFFVQDEGDNLVFFDRKQLFSLGSHLLEDIAFVIGKIDEAIPNTKDDAEGRAFPADDGTSAREIWQERLSEIVVQGFGKCTLAGAAAQHDG